MNPLVSVILPVRDGGVYLVEAVASILNQSLREIELLVVDDHSEDEAIDGLGIDDTRLHLLENPGRGVAQAFNHGLRHASGRFIARMDADDISLETRLETQLGFIQSHPDIDICGACVEIFAKHDLAGGNQRYQEWLNSCRSPQRIHRELFIESPVPNPTALFRREAIERLGGYRDPDWPEDYDLYLRADAAGMQMAKPEEVLLRWREHGQRLTRTDSRYAIERFQAAKAHFLVTRRLAGQPLVIWGAGPSGRLMHDLLQAEGAEVRGFVEIHPRRIGRQKRNLPVWPMEQVLHLEQEFVLVAVGAAGARAKIRAWMNDRERVEGRDYLFVA